MGVHRTCGEPNEIKTHTHPKYITALVRAAGIRSEEHLNLTREAATKSIVLLENNGVLPLSRQRKSVGESSASNESRGIFLFSLQ